MPLEKHRASLSRVDQRDDIENGYSTRSDGRGSMPLEKHSASSTGGAETSTSLENISVDCRMSMSRPAVVSPN